MKNLIFILENVENYGDWQICEITLLIRNKDQETEMKKVQYKSERRPINNTNYSLKIIISN